MSKCVLCSNMGQERKYFFKGKALCDKDYAGYLEFLLDESDEEVTFEDANSACKAYMLKLELKPTLSTEEEKVRIERKKVRIERKADKEEERDYSYSPNPYSMGM